jgi:lysyl-tRNA synthetase class 2
MTIPEFEEIVEQNDQTEARREHLDKLRELVGNVYPNKFARTKLTGAEDTITAILKHPPVVEIANEMAEVKASLNEGERPPAEVKDAFNERLKALGTVRIAGRLTTPPRGNFVHLTDGIAKLQIYCDKKGGFALVKNDADNTVDPENGWTAWKLIDHGDFIGVEGYLFVTNTGEVSLHVEKLQFLAKALMPMPDKMHGIADPEIRQRQRYADLIASSLQVETDGMTTRDVFETRAKVISSLRRYLEDHGYIEVETPMLTPKATGAAAKPFVTHHNALDIELYARIAPELYLKRLVVGGFEKVYELNRNFRNEGISYKHNPEFTMLEFYCAYMDVNGMMDFCEQMMQESIRKATGGLVLAYTIRDPRILGYSSRLAVQVDFSSFRRVSMTNAIVISLLPMMDFFFRIAKRSVAEKVADFFVEIIGDNPNAWFAQAGNAEAFKEMLAWLDEHNNVMNLVHDMEDDEPIDVSDEEILQRIGRQWSVFVEDRDFVEQTDDEKLKKIVGIFDEYVERVVGFSRYSDGSVVTPTFIIDYPKSISPLSKASPQNPQIAERFELFINGMEVANGFSELNDPREQYGRFIDQMSERERGDEEAMVLDEDYVRALSYGMPPAAGIGIGIDRLVMLLTNKHSIRDVILFPHLRPERKAEVAEGEETSE